MDIHHKSSSSSRKGDDDPDDEKKKGKDTALLDIELLDDEEASITKKFGNLLVVRLVDSSFKPTVTFDKAHNESTIEVLGLINADFASTICDCRSNNTTIIQIGLMRLDVQTQVSKYVICGLQNNTTSKGQNKQDWEKVANQAHKKSTSFSSVAVFRTCKSSTSFAPAFVEACKLSVNHKCRFRVRPFESKTGEKEKGEKKREKAVTSEKKEYKTELVLVKTDCSQCGAANFVNYNPYDGTHADNSKIGDTGYLNGVCSSCGQASKDPSET